MAMTFHPHKIVFNDSTELLSAAELGVGTRKYAQATTNENYTFSSANPETLTASRWKYYLTVEFETTIPQSVMYHASFSLFYESGAFRNEIRFLRDDTIIYHPDLNLGWQLTFNRATGNHNLMYLEENVPPGKHTATVSIRSFQEGTFITNYWDNGGNAYDVLGVYYY